MRKKSGFTSVEQAVVLVPEFENVVRKLIKKAQKPAKRQRTSYSFISTKIN
jgi:hypothetical protein